MLQSLIEGRSNEHTSTDRPSSMSLVHSLITMTLVTHRMETLTNILNRHIRKRSCITFTSLKDNNLTQKTLNELCDSHTRRNGVGVHNNIRDNTFCSEWHILLPIRHTNCTLLSMPRSKLVTDLWNAHVSNTNFCELISLFCGTNHDVINDTVLICFHRSTTITLCVSRWSHSCSSIEWCRLSNKNVISRHTRSRLDQTIIIKFSVLSVFHTTATVHVRLLESFRCE
mmetsp:Transcript_33330/g.48621  ORF Transcript_33330/g.48621 Transcript_33330/m.48621 type:complete len:227 (+) Transcript_33330:902-1582(+)